VSLLKTLKINSEKQSETFQDDKYKLNIVFGSEKKEKNVFIKKTGNLFGVE